MRLLGATLPRSSLALSRTWTPSSLTGGNAGQCPERLVHRGGVGEYFCDVRLEDHNVATSHPSGIRITPSSAEVILRKDVIGVDAPWALTTSLLHILCVRDESLSER
jgi:hypothetical protein